MTATDQGDMLDLLARDTSRAAGTRHELLLLLRDVESDPLCLLRYGREHVGSRSWCSGTDQYGDTWTWRFTDHGIEYSRNQPYRELKTTTWEDIDQITRDLDVWPTLQRFVDYWMDERRWVTVPGRPSEYANVYRHSGIDSWTSCAPKGQEAAYRDAYLQKLSAWETFTDGMTRLIEKEPA